MSHSYNKLIIEQISDAARNPTPQEIREIRISASLTQTTAAQLIYCNCRTWQQWEAGDRHMHPAFWELFRIKTSMMNEGKSCIQPN